MPSSTTRWLWRLCLALVLVGFAGTAHAQRTVTLRLNTATIVGDTTQTDAGTIEVRGCLTVGCTENQATLPDGNVIAWDNRTTLKPGNIGGDYWTSTFQVPADQELKFKFFSQQAEELGINGWEAGGDHILAPGTGDTTLTLHYFEKLGDEAYDWTPFEQKEDSIGVMFRVYMNTEEAQNQGYVRSDTSQRVGLRGDPLNGDSELDWTETRVFLTREGADSTKPGFDLYSGIVYYPVSAVGKAQPYKFYFEGGTDGWEALPTDRRFTVPAQDTTLHWVYYGDSKPAGVDTRVDADVIFTVDITPLEVAGVFDASLADEIQVRGGFNGWNDSNPDRSDLQPDVIQQELWLNEISVRANVGDTVLYKFYLNQGDDRLITGDAGYEEPLDFGGGNRQFAFTGEEVDLGIDFYNNIRPGNVIQTGEQIDVTFQVDMSPADTFEIAFDPATDTVRISFEDGLWEATQAKAKGLDPQDDEVQFLNLTDPDGDMIYTGTITVMGPTYNGIGYAVNYGNDTDGFETEAGGFDPGRRRYQYIKPVGEPNEQGFYEWPETYTMPLIAVRQRPSGPANLPYECNPTLTPEGLAALPENVQELCYEPFTSLVVTGSDVEPVGAARKLALGQNAPNPFRGVTTFEYSLDKAAQVRLRVYDVTGRVVTTLVDGVQAANTYRVSFDATGLASGIYFYQLETAGRVVTKKMTVVR